MCIRDSISRLQVTQRSQRYAEIAEKTFHAKPVKEEISSMYLDDALDRERLYWLEKLSGELHNAGLYLDFPRPAIYVGERDTFTIELDRDLVREVGRICSDNELLALSLIHISEPTRLLSISYAV